MTISLRAAGAATSASAAVTAVNPVVPTGATTGDLSVLTVWMKPFGTTITTPSGWTKIGEATNGTVAAGTDTGSTKVAVFVRESASAGAIGNLTLGGSPNSVGAVINTYQKDPATAWDYSQFTTGGDTANGANYSATGGAGIDVAAGDWVCQSTAVNGDVGTQSAQAIGGMSGATIGTYVNRQSADTTTGTDSHGEVGDVPITAGSSSAAPTFTYTNASSGSGTTLWLRLRELALPAATQAAFRVYQDGTEAGSTALAAQGATPTVDVTAGDVNVGLRIRLQETGGVAYAATTDWALQMAINGGAWADITTASFGARSHNSTNLTDAEATTSRLTGGTGTFVAGKVSEDGLVDDQAISASNHTELLFPLTLDADELSNGSTLTFRVLVNGVTTGMTYTSVPTISITKSLQPVSSLTEDFSDTVTPGWDAFGGGAIEGGILAVGGVAGEYISFWTTEARDFTEDEVVIQAVGNPVGTDAISISMGPTMSSNNSALQMAVQSDGNLGWGYHNASAVYTAVGSAAWDSTNHRWWRMRHTGSTIYFETSADGSSWTERGTVAVSTVAAVGFTVGSCYTYMSLYTELGAQTIGIDNYNLPPSGPPPTVIEYWGALA